MSLSYLIDLGKFSIANGVTVPDIRLLFSIIIFLVAEESSDGIFAIRQIIRL